MVLKLLKQCEIIEVKQGPYNENKDKKNLMNFQKNKNIKEKIIDTC